jgi:hypothetical protein
VIFSRLLAAIVLSASLLLSPALHAQRTNCDEGNGLIDTAEPKDTSSDAIAKKFAANEAALKSVFLSYSFSIDMTVQTLDANSITGEVRRRADIAHDAKGKRSERVSFQTVSTLRGVNLSSEDYDDADMAGLGFITPDTLDEYYVRYLGHQTVDQLATFSFEVAPKKLNKKGLFQGRVWVDDQEYTIVKTCGKVIRTDSVPARNSRQPLNVAPTFAIYREQIDGKYWFPTYMRAEDYLEFLRGGVAIRETVKHLNYKKPS